MFNFVSFLCVEDPLVIDTDSDLIESEEDCEKDSGQQISDCDSKSCDEKSDASPLKLTNVSELNLFKFFFFLGNHHCNNHSNALAQRYLYFTRS